MNEATAAALAIVVEEIRKVANHARIQPYDTAATTLLNRIAEGIAARVEHAK